MRKAQCALSYGARSFFLISLGETSFGDYYDTNFALHQFYGWSKDELENMFPFERTIYIMLTKKYQDEKKRQEGK